MLFALLDGKRVRASHYLERGADYTCPIPSCDHPELILRKGEKKAPHFAHKTRSNCADLSESDTGAHIAMKDTFQNTLGVDDDLVESTSVEGVVPDVVWKDEYAFELQHSDITPEKVQERNQIYEENDLVPVWVLHEDEGGDNVFDEGKFGKRYQGTDTINQLGDESYKVPEGKGNVKDPVMYMLNAVEKLLADLFGGLFYMQFPKKSIGKGGEDILEEGSKLNFSEENGPALTFNKMKKVVQEDDIYHRTAQTPIKDVPGLEKVLDAIKTRKKPTSEEVLERRKQQQEKEFQQRYGNELEKLNAFKRELEEKFAERTRRLESEYDNKTREKFLEFSEKGFQEALKAKDAMLQALKEKLDMARAISKGFKKGIGKKEGKADRADAERRESIEEKESPITTGAVSPRQKEDARVEKGTGGEKSQEQTKGSPPSQEKGGRDGLVGKEGNTKPGEITGTSPAQKKTDNAKVRENASRSQIAAGDEGLDRLLAKIIAFFKEYDEGKDAEMDARMEHLRRMFGD